MRACISAMQRTTRRMFVDKSLVNVEKEVAPVLEVFRLQNQSELDEAEKKYL